MNTRINFDPGKINGKPGEIRDKMKKLKIHPKVVFIITGIAATIWFLERVIPELSRAAYPCMKVASPFLSGFIIYLLSVWSIIVAARNTGSRILYSRYIATFLLVTGVVVVMAETPSQNIVGIQEKDLVKTVKTASSSGSSVQQTGTPDCQIEAGKTATTINKVPSSGQKLENQESTGKGVSVKSFDEGFMARNFYSVVIDDDNVKWFLTDAGIVSFNGTKWQMHNKNRKVPATGLKDFAYDVSEYGRELWLATSQGATVATIPVDARSGATTYYKGNSTILSDTVVAVAVGKGALRWFGTDKGVSAFFNNKWLTYSYQRQYPESLFKDFPITAMATTPGGDSLYVATDGAGVARVFRNDVDAISGASEYAIWGPIEMPSDKVYSICITPDGTQWFGTDLGIARHIGSNTLENWSIFNSDNGLVDNFVQAIAYDKTGALWFGTKGGISVFIGEQWKSFTTNDGLISNNIQCIATDKTGTVWCGTDKGVVSFNNGAIINYR